jgi:hypothetical protein
MKEKNSKLTSLNLIMTKEQKLFLKKEAEKHNVSLSAVLRYILEKVITMYPSGVIND